MSDKFATQPGDRPVVSRPRSGAPPVYRPLYAVSAKPDIQRAAPPANRPAPLVPAKGAPPVYRPQYAVSAKPYIQRAAPPAYRPAPLVPAKGAPPVYRPQYAVSAKPYIQRAAPPAYRPAPLVAAKGAPPVYRPQNAAPAKLNVEPAAPPVSRPAPQLRGSGLPTAYRGPNPAPVNITMQREKPTASAGALVVQRMTTPEGNFSQFDPALPELSTLILSTLPTEDLAAFSTTSKHWSEFVTSRPELRGRLVEGDRFLSSLRGEFGNYFTEGSNHRGKRGKGKHVVRKRRRKVETDPTTALGRLAHILFAWVKGQGHVEQEVQCLQIDDKLVITANNRGSVEALYERFTRTASEALAEMSEETEGEALTQILPTLTFSPKEKYAGRKRGTLLANLGTLGEFATADASRISVIADMDQCQSLMQESGRKFIFLRPYDCHAEQNFLLILAELERPELAEPAYIKGKKRPCAACCTTLMLFRRYWGGIKFNERGGTYFSDLSPRGLQRLVAIGVRQGKFTQGEVVEWLKETIKNQHSHGTQTGETAGVQGNTEYDSLSESSDTDEAEDMTGVAAQGSQKRKRGSR
jgi:hypothetical protein